MFLYLLYCVGSVVKSRLSRISCTVYRRDILPNGVCTGLNACDVNCKKLSRKYARSRSIIRSELTAKFPAKFSCVREFHGTYLGHFRPSGMQQDVQSTKSNSLQFNRYFAVRKQVQGGSGYFHNRRHTRVLTNHVQSSGHIGAQFGNDALVTSRTGEEARQ